MISFCELTLRIKDSHLFFPTDDDESDGLVNKFHAVFHFSLSRYLNHADNSRVHPIHARPTLLKNDLVNVRGTKPSKSDLTCCSSGTEFIHKACIVTFGQTSSEEKHHISTIIMYVMQH
jgi:hypothetical protein